MIDATPHPMSELPIFQPITEQKHLQLTQLPEVQKPTHLDRGVEITEWMVRHCAFASRHQVLTFAQWQERIQHKHQRLQQAWIQSGEWNTETQARWEQSLQRETQLAHLESQSRPAGTHHHTLVDPEGDLPEQIKALQRKWLGFNQQCNLQVLEAIHAKLNELPDLLMLDETLEVHTLPAGVQSLLQQPISRSRLLPSWQWKHDERALLDLLLVLAQNQPLCVHDLKTLANKRRSALTAQNR